MNHHPNIFIESARAAARQNPVPDVYASGAIVFELSAGFYAFPTAALGKDLFNRMAAWAARTQPYLRCPACHASARYVLPDGSRPCRCQGVPAQVAIVARALAACRKEGVAW